MECKQCGCVEFGITYKNERELNELFCRHCGQVYHWTGSYLNVEHGRRSFVNEEMLNRG